MDGMDEEKKMKNISSYTILSLYETDDELEFRSIKVT